MAKKKTEYEENYEKMKKWNEARAKAEEVGLNKFYSLRQLFNKERETKALKSTP